MNYLDEIWNGVIPTFGKMFDIPGGDIKTLLGPVLGYLDIIYNYFMFFIENSSAITSGGNN
jgi:hypothetical protein